MKYAIPTLFAAPAFAHDGIHLHPHGTDMLMLTLAAFAVVGLFIYAKVKK